MRTGPKTSYSLPGSPRKNTDNNAALIKKQLSALGEAMGNVINYSHPLTPEPGLDFSKAQANLSQYFDYNKSLTNQRFLELLKSEENFYAGLLLTTHEHLKNYDDDTNPREALISVLKLQSDKFSNCITAISALRTVAAASKQNLSALEATFTHPIGSNKFNTGFLIWLLHLSEFIAMLAPAISLIEIYQKIDPAIRKEVSNTYKSFETKTSSFLDSYFISIPQRVAKYHLLLRDIHKELRQAAQRSSFHVVFDNFEPFMSTFEAAIEQIKVATLKANGIEEQRAELKRSQSESDVTQRVFHTANGTYPIYSAGTTKQKQLLDLHNHTFLGNDAGASEMKTPNEEDSPLRTRTKTRP
tara:strand:- start:25360 stop:26430 length:1071 start_codon:yes stop_codon:yes gene_type:complete